MVMLDPLARTARGIAIQTQAIGNAPAAPESLFEESARDFIYAEIWNSDGLDLRARFLIALAGSVASAADDETFDEYVEGALSSGALSLVELREAALHMGPYGGWPKAKRLDKAVTRTAKKLGLAAETAPIRAQAWDPEVRDREGAAEFLKVMVNPSGPPVTPYLQAIHNFVFGEMWMRRSLDERSRRWLTLVGVCDSTVEIPVKSHVHAAMASGNCTVAEMHEFILQFGVHCGWPKASLAQAAVFEMSKKVEAGLPWHG